MIDALRSGGFMMLPLLLCSIAAMTIILERIWLLRRTRVAPPEVIPRVWDRAKNQQTDPTELRLIKTSSPLGNVLATVLSNRHLGRDGMKESAEQAGRRVVHDLEKHLDTLGTIASVSPYLGLLGSVLGMIKVFSAFSAEAQVADPARLAGGLSEILIATAAGLAVAIPSLIFYRYFQRKISELTIQLEEEAVTLIDALPTLSPNEGARR